MVSDMCYVAHLSTIIYIVEHTGSAVLQSERLVWSLMCALKLPVLAVARQLLVHALQY
jgi:hypothetical protein